jgi:hypothetical protein
MEGKVGIHRPYLEVPRQQVTADTVREVYQKTLGDIRAYLREMNVSEQLADAMLRINPENMRILDYAALNNYGLTFEDPIAQKTFDLEQAQFYNVDRQEYIRRKTLAESRCGGPIAINSKCYRSIMETGHNGRTWIFADRHRFLALDSWGGQIGACHPDRCVRGLNAPLRIHGSAKGSQERTRRASHRSTGS